MVIERRGLRTFDLATLLNVALLLALGIALVASASSGGGQSGLFTRQLIWSLAGLLVASALGIVEYRNFTDRAYLLWGVTVGVLVLTLMLAPERAGTHSWIALGSFTIQPAEFAKVAVILALARYFSEREPRPFGLRGLLSPALIVAVPFLLTLLQPDLGTAATLIPVLLGMAWVAGLELRTLGWLGGIAAACAPLGYLSLHDYQRARLLTFLSPEDDPLGAGYQIMQSKIAVGSGGLTGKGLFSGTQSQLAFLPEQHNDFIVAVLGEELGFLGILVALGLYTLLLLRILQTARMSRDRTGTYLATGVASLLAFHLAINVGMVIGFAPITGIPLPLLSYGGSSVLATCGAIGLALAVRSRRFLV